MLAVGAGEVIRIGIFIAIFKVFFTLFINIIPDVFLMEGELGLTHPVRASSAFISLNYFAVTDEHRANVLHFTHNFTHPVDEMKRSYFEFLISFLSVWRAANVIREY